MSAKVVTAARLGIAAFGLSAAFAAIGQPAGSGANGGSVKAATPKAPVTAEAAAKPAAAAAGDDAATIAKGRELFANWGCNSCHSLADANAQGHVGPALDGNANLTKPFVVDRVTNGQGPMPAFGGQMTDQEIDTIATYIIKVAAK